MDTYDVMLLAALFLGLGFIAGIAAGMEIESRWGHVAKTVKRQHEALLRIIPKLRNHYTEEYIYYELLQNRSDSDG